MSLLTPNTCDTKMDEAYAKLKVHIDKCRTFDEFLQHFNYIVKTDDAEVLNKWLLKVLYVNMKLDDTHKHDFDKLLESVGHEGKEKLTAWLSSELEKFS